MIRRYLTAEEVAGELGMNREKFYRQRRRLERERGFPRPVVDMGYDPLSIRLWQDAQLAGEATPARPALPPPHLRDGEDDDPPGDWDAVIRQRVRAL